jgi:hypothetical protein
MACVHKFIRHGYGMCTQVYPTRVWHVYTSLSDTGMASVHKFIRHGYGMCTQVSSQAIKTVTTLNAELNPTCPFLALLGAHPILHVSRIRVNTDFHDKSFQCNNSFAETEISSRSNPTIRVVAL